MTEQPEPPLKQIAYEDFEVGAEIPIGTRQITAEEIIEFAREFDPQPAHLDANPRGGLDASGWHVCCISMRMMCDSYLLNSTSQGAPGVEYVRWIRPVLAGDTLTGKTRVVEKRVSRSRPNLGFVVVEHTLENQRGEIVTEMRNTGMFLLRGAAG